MSFNYFVTHLDNASENATPPGEEYDYVSCVQAHSVEPGESDKSVGGTSCSSPITTMLRIYMVCMYSLPLNMIIVMVDQRHHNG